MNLHDDPDAFDAVAGAASLATGVPVDQIEKDYWITLALRALCEYADEHEFTLIFKGGTSLSKAFQLIERFSEDVDVLVILSAASSAGERDRHLKGLIVAAARGCGLEAVLESGSITKAKKRAARLHYPSRSPHHQAQQGVLIEIGTRGGSLPHTTQQIGSLIAAHAQVDLSEMEGLETFGVEVLSPARTLAEKLVLLHTCHSAEVSDPKERLTLEATIAKTARHYYDVWCLLNHPPTVAEFVSLRADALGRDVVVYSHAADMAAEHRPVGGFAQSPAFSARQSPLFSVARESYELLVADLVWPGVVPPTFEECVALVVANADIL